MVVKNCDNEKNTIQYNCHVSERRHRKKKNNKDDNNDDEQDSNT